MVFNNHPTRDLPSYKLHRKLSNTLAYIARPFSGMPSLHHGEACKADTPRPYKVQCRTRCGPWYLHMQTQPSWKQRGLPQTHQKTGKFSPWFGSIRPCPAYSVLLVVFAKILVGGFYHVPHQGGRRRKKKGRQCNVSKGGPVSTTKSVGLGSLKQLLKGSKRHKVGDCRAPRVSAWLSYYMSRIKIL